MDKNQWILKEQSVREELAALQISYADLEKKYEQKR